MVWVWLTRLTLYVRHRKVSIWFLLYTHTHVQTPTHAHTHTHTHTHTQHHIKTLLGSIKNSPLLTEEDSQLLAFVLNYSDEEYQTKNNTENLQTNETDSQITHETESQITHETESQTSHKTDSQTSHKTDSQTAHPNFLILSYYSVAVVFSLLSVLWVLCGPVISGCGLLGLVITWLLIEQVHT